MSSFPGSNHELAAEGSVAHGLLDEYVSAQSHRPAKDGPEEMEACLEGEQPLPMLERPRGLIDLRARVLVPSAQAAVCPQRPLVEHGVDGGGKAARTHGEDLPRREAGAGNHRLERCKVREPRDAVACRRGYVRERQ